MPHRPVRNVYSRNERKRNVALSGKWHRLIVRQRAWRMKQVRGRLLPPLSKEPATCVNCGLGYVGNFCPRCGQGRSVPRFSINGMLGNVLKTIFRVDGRFARALLELLYRPGHLMRDYIRGRRVHYTPPLTMLFLVIMFYVIVSALVEPLVDSRQVEAVASTAISTEEDEFDVLDLFGNVSRQIDQALEDIPVLANAWQKLGKWASDNRAFQTLLSLPLLAVSTRWAVRRRSSRDDYNLMEHIFIQAYIASQQYIISILLVPLTLLLHQADPLEMPLWLAFLLYWWTFRQLFLCSWWRAFMRTALMAFYFSLITMGIGALLVFAYYLVR